jgi:hypothetical protein
MSVHSGRRSWHSSSGRPADTDIPQYSDDVINGFLSSVCNANHEGFIKLRLHDNVALLVGHLGT